MMLSFILEIISIIFCLLSATITKYKIIFNISIVVVIFIKCFLQNITIKDLTKKNKDYKERCDGFNIKKTNNILFVINSILCLGGLYCMYIEEMIVQEVCINLMMLNSFIISFIEDIIKNSKNKDDELEGINGTLMIIDHIIILITLLFGIIQIEGEATIIINIICSSYMLFKNIIQLIICIVETEKRNAKEIGEKILIPIIIILIPLNLSGCILSIIKLGILLKFQQSEIDITNKYIDGFIMITSLIITKLCTKMNEKELKEIKYNKRLRVV